MFNQSSIKKYSKHILDKESLPSNLNVLPLQNLVMELDECNEESLLGGSFAGEGYLHPRLTDQDVSTQALASHSGIRSIPTLMV